ncbi:hypothetical protein NDU88_004518 [Pleurodeles waltl]|uniref:Uncharacterized protein n=1 Tax=Pleurodeles waltl TaxID=8319 RepID=A0AAV7TRG8_PLEWA|nr:hypothetical protein NDU88_004518 [Pleurodeles waltl]
MKGVKSHIDLIEATVAQQGQVQDAQGERVSALETQQRLLSDGLAEYENRSCHNSIRITGVSATTPNAELEAYVQPLFSHLLQDSDAGDLTHERTHRVSSLSAVEPAYTRCSYQSPLYPVKENILKAAWKFDFIILRCDTLTLFQNILLQTLVKHQDFDRVLSYLCISKILYYWGFPLCLLFTFPHMPDKVRAVLHMVPSVESGVAQMAVLSLQREIDGIRYR